MDQEIASGALQAVGYLGKWEIDYTTMKVRATGRVGPYYGVLKHKMRDGINLSLCDGAYIPEHLEMIKRHRRSAVGHAGRYHLRFLLRSNYSNALTPVQSFAHLTTDRFGILQGGKGILCEDVFNQHLASNDTCSREDALHSLRKAQTAVECLGLFAMGGVLKEIFKEVSRHTGGHLS